MLDPGTAGCNVDVNVSVGAGTVTATNAANIDYAIGATHQSLMTLLLIVMLLFT